MAPLAQRLREEPAFETRVCVTSQHRELLDQGLSLFDLVPDYDLGLMRPNQDVDDLKKAVLAGLETVFADWRPDRVIVHGDTTTAFAAALAAFDRRIPIAHVEAGLRSGDANNPWPEEANRRLVDAMADLHFAPTQLAARNLLSEGADPGRVIVTGNTGIDAFLRMRAVLAENPGIEHALAARFSLPDDRRLILVTGHRRENLGDGLDNVCRALLKLAARGDVQILFPVHLNPNVKTAVSRMLDGQDAVSLVTPQDYLRFVYLMTRSHFIITDSGGIQEEAPALGKPVLVTRYNTERPEAVTAGTVCLVGLDPEMILSEASGLLDDADHYDRMARAHNPYGDGFATIRIVNSLKQLYAVSAPDKMTPVSAFVG